MGNGGSEIVESIRVQRQRIEAGRLPTFPGDDALLRRLVHSSPDHGRAVASMVSAIRQALAIEIARGSRAPRLVAFSSSGSVTRSIENELRELEVPIAGYSISARTTVAESRRVISQFQHSSEPSVLVGAELGQEKPDAPGQLGRRLVPDASRTTRGAVHVVELLLLFLV